MRSFPYGAILCDVAVHPSVRSLRTHKATTEGCINFKFGENMLAASRVLLVLTRSGKKVTGHGRVGRLNFRIDAESAAPCSTGNPRKIRHLLLLLSCAKSHMLSASRRQPRLLHVSAVDRRQTWSMDKS